jgi:hypothetical protein
MDCQISVQEPNMKPETAVVLVEVSVRCLTNPILGLHKIEA